MKTQLDNWHVGSTRGIDKFIEYEGTHAYEEGIAVFLGNNNLEDILLWRDKNISYIHKRKILKMFPIGPFKLVYPFEKQKTIPVVGINYVTGYAGLCEVMVIDIHNLQNLSAHLCLKGNLSNSFFPLSDPPLLSKKVIEQYDTLNRFISMGRFAVTEDIVDAINALLLPSVLGMDITGIFRQEMAIMSILQAYYDAVSRNTFNIYLNIGTCGFIGYPVKIDNLNALKSLELEIDPKKVSCILRKKAVNLIRNGLSSTYPLFPIQGISNMDVFCYIGMDYLPPPDAFLLAGMMGANMMGLMTALSVYEILQATRTTFYYIYFLSNVMASVKNNVMVNIAANITDYVVSTPTHWFNLMGYGAPYLNIMSKDGYIIIATADINDTVTFASPLREIKNTNKQVEEFEVESKVPNKDRLFTKVNFTFTDELLMMDSFIGTKCIFDNIEEDDLGKLTAHHIYPAVYLLSFEGKNNADDTAFCKSKEITEEEDRLCIVWEPLKSLKGGQAYSNLASRLGTHAINSIEDTYKIYEEENSPYYLSKCFIKMKEDSQLSFYIENEEISIPTSVSAGTDVITYVSTDIIEKIINKIKAKKSVDNLNLSENYYIYVPFTLNILINNDDTIINWIGTTKSINIINPNNCNNVPFYFDYKGKYNLFRKYSSGTYKQELFVYLAGVDVIFTVIQAHIKEVSSNNNKNPSSSIDVPIETINIADEINAYKFLTEGIKISVRLKGERESKIYLLQIDYEFSLNPVFVSLIDHRSYEGIICFPKCHYSNNSIYTYTSNEMLVYELNDHMSLVKIRGDSWENILGQDFKVSVVGNFNEFIEMIGEMQEFSNK